MVIQFSLRIGTERHLLTEFAGKGWDIYIQWHDAYAERSALYVSHIRVPGSEPDKNLRY